MGLDFPEFRISDEHQALGLVYHSQTNIVLKGPNCTAGPAGGLIGLSRRVAVHVEQNATRSQAHLRDTVRSHHVMHPDVA